MNVTGTLNLLEEAAAAGVESFVFTSTTSVFGDASRAAGRRARRRGSPRTSGRCRRTSTASPRPRRRTCASSSTATTTLPCVVLRTSRFFPEPDDDPAVRAAYADENVQAERIPLPPGRPGRRRRTPTCWPPRHAPAARLRRYVISATTPFTPDDLAGLRADAPAVVRRLVPEYEAEYARRGWRMAPSIDRVYVNERARTELGLAAALRLPVHDRTVASGRGLLQSARAARRVEGVPRQSLSRPAPPAEQPQKTDCHPSQQKGVSKKGGSHLSRRLFPKKDL